MERSWKVQQHNSQKLHFQIFVGPVPHLQKWKSFINIRSTAANDTSLEKSWVLQCNRSWNLVFALLRPCPIPKFLKAPSISGLQCWMIHQWKGLDEFYSLIEAKFSFLHFRGTSPTLPKTSEAFLNIGPRVLNDTSLEKSWWELQKNRSKDHNFLIFWGPGFSLPKICEDFFIISSTVLSDTLMERS